MSSKQEQHPKFIERARCATVMASEAAGRELALWNRVAVRSVDLLSLAGGVIRSNSKAHWDLRPSAILTLICSTRFVPRSLWIQSQEYNWKKDALDMLSSYVSPHRYLPCCHVSISVICSGCDPGQRKLVLFDWTHMTAVRAKFPRQLSGLKLKETFCLPPYFLRYRLVTGIKWPTRKKHPIIYHGTQSNMSC